MARDRKDIAGERRQRGVEAPVAGDIASGLSSSGPHPFLALSALPLQHREQILALVRALARDAARADHAAEQAGRTR